MRFKLLNDLAVAEAECAGSVSLICIDVHSTCEVGVNTNYNVTEYGGSVIGLDLDRYDLLIGNTCLSSLFGCEMDVTLSNDNALSDLNLTARSYDFAGCAALNVAALTNGSCNTESSCICIRNLNLCCGTSRSEDYNVCNRLLGAYESYSLLASKLTGLAKVLLMCKRCACTKKCFDICSGKMHVACAGFYKYFVVHW